MVSTRLLGGAGAEYRGLAAVATLLPTLVCTPWTLETLATMPLLNCKLFSKNFRRRKISKLVLIKIEL